MPPFLPVNPKGKVPNLLRDDGPVLTKFAAIATSIARTNPDQPLLPAEADGEARVVETLSYVEGTIHGQWFARIFSPSTFGLEARA